MRTEEAVTARRACGGCSRSRCRSTRRSGRHRRRPARPVARRWREEGEPGPGPRQAGAVRRPPTPSRRRPNEQGRRRRRDPLDRGHPLRRLRRRRLRRRHVGPGRRRRARRGERARDQIDRSIAPRLGGEPRLADLRPGRALDRLPRGLLRGDDHALHPAGAGGAGDRAARLGLRLPPRPAGAGARARDPGVRRSPRC